MGFSAVQFALVVGAVVTRLALAFSPWQPFLANRVEIVTLPTSLKAGEANLLHLHIFERGPDFLLSFFFFFFFLFFSFFFSSFSSERRVLPLVEWVLALRRRDLQSGTF